MRGPAGSRVWDEVGTPCNVAGEGDAAAGSRKRARLVPSNDASRERARSLRRGSLPAASKITNGPLAEGLPRGRRTSAHRAPGIGMQKEKTSPVPRRTTRKSRSSSLGGRGLRATPGRVSSPARLASPRFTPRVRRYDTKCGTAPFCGRRRPTFESPGRSVTYGRLIAHEGIPRCVWATHPHRDRHGPEEAQGVGNQGLEMPSGLLGRMAQSLQSRRNGAGLVRKQQLNVGALVC